MDLFSEALEQRVLQSYLLTSAPIAAVFNLSSPVEMREFLINPTTPAQTLFKIDDFYSTELGCFRNLRL